MHIFKYLANLPYNSLDNSIWLNCDLQPSGRWLLACEAENVKIIVEISHNAFTAWLKSKKIEHDINAESYSLEI